MPPIKFKFPHQLFVKKDESDVNRGVGDVIFFAEDRIDKLGEIGEEVEVAVYKLDHCGILVTKPEMHIKD